jgi:hypothetical protein
LTDLIRPTSPELTWKIAVARDVNVRDCKYGLLLFVATLMQAANALPSSAPAKAAIHADFRVFSTVTGLT